MKGVILPRNMCHSVIAMVELVGVPGSNSGAGHRVGGPKKSAEFLLHMLKNAESNAEFKGLDVDFYSLSTSSEQSLRDAAQNLQNGFSHM